MLELNFTPFPELSTERLLLRRLTLQDAPEIFSLRSDPAVLQFIGREPTASIKEAEDFITRIDNNIQANESILWAMVLKSVPSTTIGTICLWNIQKENYRSEIGYALLPSHWRKGLMKEAILKVVEYGFSIGLHSIEARLNAANIASAAILESTGFVKEAYFRDEFFFRGKFSDTLVYSKLNG